MYGYRYYFIVRNSAFSGFHQDRSDFIRDSRLDILMTNQSTALHLRSPYHHHSTRYSHLFSSDHR